jgi:hypothetical protein
MSKEGNTPTRTTNDQTQQALARFVRNLRYGQNDIQNWKWSQNDEMQLSAQTPEDQKRVASWPRIFMGCKGGELADDYNAVENRRMGVPLVTIVSKQFGGGASYARKPHQEFGNIPPSVTVSIGTRVMSLKNEWTNAGLTNGLTGTVVAILFKSTNDTGMPDPLMVKWDEQYAGPTVSLNREQFDRDRKRVRQQNNTSPKNTHHSLIYKSNHTLTNEVIQQLLRSVNTQLPSEAERSQRPRLGLDDKAKDSIRPFIASLLEELLHHTATQVDRPRWSLQSTEKRCAKLHIHRHDQHNIIYIYTTST